MKLFKLTPICLILILFALSNPALSDNKNKTDKEKQHLIIINKKDSVYTDAKTYFHNLDAEKILSIKVTDDEKIVKKAGVKSIIEVELKEYN
jgi:hypothetical protein